MLINCDGVLKVYGVAIELVERARYLGVEIRSDCRTRATRCQSMALVRHSKALQGMHLIKSHIRYSGLRSRLVRTMLVEAFATSRLMFGSVVWGHIFGPKLQLRRTGASAASRIEIAHRRHIRWALKIPSCVRLGFLFVLAN